MKSRITAESGKVIVWGQITSIEVKETKNKRSNIINGKRKYYPKHIVVEEYNCCDLVVRSGCYLPVQHIGVFYMAGAYFVTGGLLYIA